MKVIDLLNKIANSEEVPKKFIYNTGYAKLKFEYDEDKNNWYCYEKVQWFDDVNLMYALNDEVEILDEEEKKIEIPQEFLADVNSESEIVLIKDDIRHDYGYKNSVGFITSRSSMGECFIFAFDKIANRWWSCRFDKDEYIRTGLFVSDLFKPFVTLTPSKEDEFIDIEEFCISYSLDYIDYRNIDVLKNYLNKDFQTIFDTLDKLIKNQKKIIEKLKEEGK